ncbi:MAG: hypothetical protein WBC02_05650 [Candidatus Aminicenantaceae bacterium]
MKEKKFKSMGKKLIFLITLFAVITFATDSYAKEKKHGAKLLIQTLDGQIIKAELLAVKGSKLILMDDLSLSGITTDIYELISIRILKKSKLLKGLGAGLLIGGGSGALLGLLSGDDPPGWFSMTAGQKALIGGLGLAILSAPIGGIWGAIKGIDESIILEGRPNEEVDSILKKLNSKSRFPLELPHSYKMTNSLMKKKVRNPVEKNVIQKKHIRFNERHYQKPRSSKFSRFHFTFNPGYFNSHGVKDYSGYFKDWGFGDTKPGGELMLFFVSFGSYGPTDFPQVAKDPVIFFKNIRIEYSINQKFALGVGYFPLGEHEIHGYKYVTVYKEGRQYYTDLYLLGNYSGSVYYITGAWMPIPDAFLRKSSFKLGAGIGISNLNLDFRTSEWRFSGGKGDNINFSKNGLTFIAFGEYDYFFNRHWSVGVNIDYKYIPVKIEDFQLTGYYVGDYDEQFNMIYSSMILNFPEKRVSFGGFGFGINFGLHF